MAKAKRDVADVERDARAVDLRRTNLSYRQIAGQLDVSVSTAHSMVQRGLADTVAESNEEVRRLELERLDHLARASLNVLNRRHIIVSHGAVVMDPATRQPLVDDAPTLQATDRLLKIMDRRAKLLGLDAPTKVEMITTSLVDSEIERLEKELGVVPEG